MPPGLIVAALAAGLSARPEAYRSRRALTPDPSPDIATPRAISKIAPAATPATANVMGSTSVPPFVGPASS